MTGTQHAQGDFIIDLLGLKVLGSFQGFQNHPPILTSDGFKGHCVMTRDNVYSALAAA